MEAREYAENWDDREYVEYKENKLDWAGPHSSSPLGSSFSLTPYSHAYFYTRKTFFQRKFCTLAHLHTFIFQYLHTCILAYLYTCLLAKFHSCRLSYFHTCILAYLHTYILAYLNTCIVSYLHTCTLAGNFQVPSRHLSDTFQIPSGQLLYTFQTPSTHLSDSFQTTSLNPPYLTDRFQKHPQVIQ